MNNLESFVLALDQGDNHQCFLLFEKYPELANERYNGVSLLLTCLFYNQFELAEMLAKEKVEMDLFEAAGLGISSKIKSLIEKGENPDALNKNGYTPLGLACHFGQFEAVKWLFTLGANVNKPMENELGSSPLHAAVGANSFPIVEFLVSKGAFINAQQKNGTTALYAAVNQKNLELTRFLLDQKAAINIKMPNVIHLKELVSNLQLEEFDLLFKNLK
jgi:uncharacterized protein